MDGMAQAAGGQCEDNWILASIGIEYGEKVVVL